MAITFDPQGHWSTYDQPEKVLYRDWSPILATTLRQDVSFLSMLSIGTPSRSIKYEWGKQEANPVNIVATNDAAGALLSGETTFTVVAASKAYMYPGMVLRDVAKTNVQRDDGPDGYELLLVSDWEESTATATVVRDYGHDTTGYTLPNHAQAATYRIVTILRPDKSTAGNNMWTGSDSEYNICQCFRYDLGVSGAALEQQYYGTNSQTMADQIFQRTIELKEHLGNSVLYGIQHRVKPLGAADDGAGEPAYRSMDGIFTAALRLNGTNVDDTSTVFDEDFINDKTQEAQAVGGLRNNRARILISYSQARKVSAWDKDKIRIDPNMTSRGGYVKTYTTDLGVECDFIKDKQVFDSDIAILDPAYMPSLHALGSRAWFSFEYRNDEDGRNAAIIGDWTNEFRHAGKVHFFCTALTL